MKNKRIYLCEEGIDGIFSAIYDAWASKYGHNNIKIEIKAEQDNYEFFSEYIEIDTDYEKAKKVADSIKKKISNYAYEIVCSCAMAKEKERADAIYRFLLLGFTIGQSVVDQLSHPYVHALFVMERNVTNEILHYRGFLRFTELENKILAAKIRPQNNIIALLAPHFADRLSNQNWMIYDIGRKKVVIHKASEEWFYTDASELKEELLEDYSEKELDIQLIWKHFVDAIAIKERKNLHLQKQLLPKRYREFMKEMK